MHLTIINIHDIIGMGYMRWDIVEIHKTNGEDLYQFKLEHHNSLNEETIILHREADTKFEEPHWKLKIKSKNVDDVYITKKYIEDKQKFVETLALFADGMDWQL